MTSRGLVPLALGLAVLLAPAPAGACSCSGSPTLDIESCRSAAHVFAGTVEAVDAPFLFELDSSTIVRLKVDTVWRGDPPAALLAYTGGPCGSITPPPGAPFLACEDDTGDISWMALSMCGYPRFDAAPEIRATLGPGHPPTAAPTLHWQWWHTRQVLLSLAYMLALPLLGILLGGGLGRWKRRRAAPTPAAVRSPTRGLLLLAAAIVATRLGLHATLPDAEYYARAAASQHHGSIIMGAVVVIATLVGLSLGYRGQRRPGRHGPWRGLAFAFIGTGMMMFAGFARLHVPIQPADAVACSVARAREFLRTAPIRYDTREDEDDEWDASPTAIAGGEEALRVAYAAVPYACTDWGLRRMRFDPLSSCLDFEDGLGGTYHQCVDPREDRYTVEGPG